MTSAEARKKYLLDNAQLAVDVTAGTKIFPETTIVISIYESSGNVGGVWMPGESKLAKDAKNFFGIKAGSKWTGETYDIKTQEYVWEGFPPRQVPKDEIATFRAYDTKAESFEDFVNLLQTGATYAANGVLTAKTVSEQLTAIGKAGYGTNPTYATSVNQIYAAMQNDIREALKEKEGKKETSGAGALAVISVLGISFYLLTK